ncbi:MBL fold metallo-hydrolase [Candidatus Dojkabacteria bacterium]|nr:MBL fold metallo-hydrolase [Candidatus Dojkabacteria bacterium]
MSIKFFGAAETVTGSCYLVKTGNVSFLVDCGMFQGKDVEYRNYEKFEFAPKQIDFVVITHAHLDHLGLLPRLVREGFRGKVYSTQKTSALSYHLLLDAAKIQENNLQKRLSTVALYDTTDAIRTIQLFNSKSYKDVFEDHGVKMQFEKVGHVLGAASLKVIDKSGITGYFSGDIGRLKHPFLETFDTAERKADFVLMEALYGGIVHPDREKTEAEFVSYINETIDRNGNVIIPAFALQRTQEILNILKKAYREDRIKKKVGIFVDSPLAINMTNEYTQSIFANDVQGAELFDFEKVRYIMKPGRMLKNSKGEPKIIIAGSGMCEGGRILGHLSSNLPDPKNAIAIVGFQAEDTLGRELTLKPEEIYINKKRVKVRARIKQFYGFSAHGDTTDLQAWLDRFEKKSLKKVFLVHAEPQRMQKFDEINADLPIYIPKWKEEVSI